MELVCIYPFDAEDFSTNGMGALTPEDYTVHEVANGEYELELIQPIDSTNRWALLQAGAIIKATVPMRESPFYEDAEEITEGETVTKQREIYAVKSGATLNFREGPSTSSKRYGSYKGGTEVIKLAVQGSWMQVAIRNGGAVGWMNTRYLTYKRVETEVITQARVIGTKALAHTQSREQLFRIYETEPSTKARRVTARCLHIFYDLLDDAIHGELSPQEEPIADVVAEMAAKLGNQSFTFHVAAGMTAKITGEYGYMNPVEALLDPESGILAQARALLLRDNYDIWILPDTPRNNGVTIRRGKNLNDAKPKINITGVKTRVYPRGQTKDGNLLWLADAESGRYIDSPNHFNDYANPREAYIDYDVKIVDKDPDNVTTFKTIAAARAKLRELGEAEFTENGIDLPVYSLDVDFAILQNSTLAQEYPEWGALQAVNMNDTVTVIDELIGMRAATRVCETTVSGRLGKYTKLRLGEIESIENSATSYSIPNGSLTGAKFAIGSVGGEVLRQASIQYAKIETAAIEQLAANALTAHIAHIDSLTADTLEADELAAAYGRFLQLVSDKINVGEITADKITGIIANLQVVTAGQATFDAATVKHLVSNFFNLDGSGTFEDVYIYNLVVTYAQLASAIVDNLALKGDDGHYYRITVNNGQLSPTLIPDSQIDEETGMTTDGKRSLIDSALSQLDMTSGPTIKGLVGVINRVYASVVDTDVLLAREAFISKLATTQIVGNRTITMIAQDAQNAQTSIDRVVRIDGSGLHVGDNRSNGEVLIDSESVNVVYNGQRYSKFAANYVQFGNYQLRKSSDGGLAFKLKGGN